MRNHEAAALLERIGDLLEVKGESPFRVAAYREAARRIDSLTEDIVSLHTEGQLESIPGVGPSIAAKLNEYLRTGRLSYLEDLEKQVEPGVADLVKIPGLGPRRAQLIHERLGVSSIADLARAAREHRLSKLPGIRDRLEERILREVDRLQQRSRRLLLGVALPAAERVAALLRQSPSVLRIDPAGSIRRMRETIGDIDVLVASDRPLDVMDAFIALPMVKEVLARGPTKSSILTLDSLQIDLRVVKPEEYGAALQHFTGSKAHNIALRDLAIARGLKLNEYGIFDERTGRRLAGETEAEVYEALGLPWIPPEMRENRGEIEAAQRGDLPELVREDDILGDFHVHSDWSDGVSSIEAVAEAARARGYEYVAITDHSQGLGIARGLSVERIRQQRKVVDEVNRRLVPFVVLHGIEVNIRRDGSLDYPDEIVRQFDIVTASIHSGFDQPREVMTGRIIKAIHHPYVDVLNHPTGRLIDRRSPYAVDLEAVIQAAVESGTALEINGQPDRLDLDDVWARRAKETGTTLAIDSDAHSADQLDLIRFGVAVARRAWLEKGDVLNTLSLDRLHQRLHRFRRAA